ncbi:hypothetical protein [Persephonella sp.]
MNYERVAWWIFWIAFGLLLFLLFYGMTLIFLTSTSVEFAYLLGLVSFLLIGNRLIFGYGWIAYILDSVISLKQIRDEHTQKVKEKLQTRAMEPEEKLKELSFKAMIMLLLKDQDYYRYAYYGIFLLLTVLTLLAKFNLLGEFVIGKYLEGVFWGAATVTFFVWGVEQLSKVSFVEYNLLDFEKNKKNGG